MCDHTLIFNLIISKEPFQIAVRSHCFNFDMPLVVHDNDTIMDVKKKIALILPGTSPDSLGVFHNIRKLGNELDDEKTLEDCEVEPVITTLRVEKCIWIRLHYFKMNKDVEFRHAVTPPFTHTIYEFKKLMVRTKRLKQKRQTIELMEPALYGDNDSLVDVNENTLDFVINEKKKKSCVLM